MFFVRRTPQVGNDRLLYCRFENGKLTIPEHAPFGYGCLELYISFTPDGMRIYYTSMRPLPGEDSLCRMLNIWLVSA